jgi:O-antigen/teichoic acid export membrane protein
VRSIDIAKSGAMVVAAIATGTILTFATHMVISRTLGVAGYGDYAILIAWAMLLSLPASLGADGAILKFVPGYLHDERNRTTRSLIMASLCLQALGVLLIGGLLAVANAIGVPALGWAHGETLVVVMLLIAATVGGNTTIAAMQSSHRAVTSQFIAQVVRPMLNLVVVGATILSSASPPEAVTFVALAAVSNLTVFAAMAVYIHLFYPRSEPGEQTLQEPRNWIQFSLSNLLAGVAQQGLVQLPVLLVGNLANSTEAGLYGVASRLAVAVSMGLSALSTVSISTFAKASHIGDHRLIQGILTSNAWLALSYTSMAGLAMWLLGPTILGLFGPGFVAAYPTLLGLVLGLVLVSTMGSAIAIVVMNGRPLVVACANLVGIVLIGGLCAVLVSRLGAVGGAIASTVGTLAAVGLVTVYAYARLGFNPTIVASRARGKVGR